MLADPTFAEMVQAIGEASLGADDKAIWHLTKVGGSCFSWQGQAPAALRPEARVSTVVQHQCHAAKQLPCSWR